MNTQITEIANLTKSSNRRPVRTRTVSTRVTEAEYSALQEQAWSTGKTVCDWAGRRVVKFQRSLLVTDGRHRPSVAPAELEDDRLIPSSVKLEVWKRDQGRCRMCGSKSGLHFDHIIPYSNGGSSKNPANIQILCGRHNLAKGDNVE